MLQHERIKECLNLLSQIWEEMQMGFIDEDSGLHPEVHYCRECIYWAGDETSIGRRCTNTERRRGRTRPSGSSDYKYSSTKACKTGFEPLPDPKQLRLEDIIQKEDDDETSV